MATDEKTFVAKGPDSAMRCRVELTDGRTIDAIVAPSELTNTESTNGWSWLRHSAAGDIAAGENRVERRVARRQAEYQTLNVDLYGTTFGVPLTPRAPVTLGFRADHYASGDQKVTGTITEVIAPLIIKETE